MQTTRNIYKSRYQSIDFDEQTGILYENWKPASISLNDKEFKKEMLQQVKAVETTNAKAALTNTIDLKYAIHPNMQEWMNATVFPKFINLGIKQVAMLQSHELITRLSVEQTMREKTGKSFTIKYFADVKDAEVWLLDS